MKLLMVNGSPRYKKSNSHLLAEYFLNGFRSVNSQNSVKYLSLQNKKEKEAIADELLDADSLICIFPLYTDCMPAIVKEFLEMLHSQKRPPAFKIGFIVHSGFPEALHSVPLERYLMKYVKRIGCVYLGTIIKGGSEGIRIQPPMMTRRIFASFDKLGAYFAANGAFDIQIKEQLAKPYCMSTGRRFIFSLLSKTGLTNFYWNTNLKKHGAYENRFDRPFVQL